MGKLPRIRTPFGRVLDRARTRLLPMLVFIACVAATLSLWNRQTGVHAFVGEAEAVRYDVASAVDGRLVPLPETIAKLPLIA